MKMASKLEPQERVVIDVADNFIGIIMETLGIRRGEMIKMSNHGSGRVRMEFKHSLARPDRSAQPVAYRHARHCSDSLHLRRLD